MDKTNQCHIIAEVTGSNPVSPTIKVSHQFQVVLFLVR